MIILSGSIDLDWYTYLTEDFKLHRAQYRVYHRVVVDCPKCDRTQVVRLNNLKAKIKRLGKYECARCRKSEALKETRKLIKKRSTK